MYKNNESCPPIVSEELWDKCNEILNKNSKNYQTKTRTNMKYALSGKIKCYHDGATFIKGAYKNKRTGVESKYWGCSNYRKYGKEKLNGCNHEIIPDRIEAGTFLIIAAAAGEKVIVQNVIPQHLEAVTSKLKENEN